MTYYQETLDLINDCKYKLKSRSMDDEIANAFNEQLNHLINIFVLDQDPHIFASIPIKLERIKIDSNKLFGNQFKSFMNFLYDLLPENPIDINSFVARAINNIDLPKSSFENPNPSQIKLAILALNEKGLIKLDNNFVIKKNRRNFV